MGRLTSLRRYALKASGANVSGLIKSVTDGWRRHRSGSILIPRLTGDQHPVKYRFLLRTPDRSSHPICRGVIQVNLSAACELRRDLALSSNDNAWAIRNPLLDEARDLHKMTVYGSLHESRAYGNLDFRSSWRSKPHSLPMRITIQKMETGFVAFCNFAAR